MQYIRKILFTFICFFVISNVYAAEITINSNDTVNVDSNIDVTINISDDIEAWQFDLNYDSNVLQLISSDLESTTRSASISNMHTRTYNLTFKALTNNNTTISLSNVSGYDTNENILNVTTNAKAINSIYTGWVTLNGNTYYYDENGNMLKGLQEIDGNKYFFGENSFRLFTTTVTALDGTTYEPDSEGKLYSRWIERDGNTYHTDENGVKQRGLQEIDGNKYFFGENSYRLFKTTVTALDGTIYEPDEEGKLYSRWFERNGNTYHTDNNGIMLKGIQEIDGNKYFLGEISGKLCIGFVTSLNGNMYYTNSDGIIQTGEQQINNQTFKFDSNGILLSGWYTIDNKKYYIDENNKVVSGFKEINNNTYYFINGVMQTGEITIDNNIYYFSNDGILTKIQYIPVYYHQKDGRWANNYYGRWKLGPTGCLPTSMAMALSGILSTSILPSDVANYLYNYTNEYNKSFGGSSGLAIVYSANNYNVIAEGISSYAQMVEALANGKIIVGSVGNGKFAWNYTHAIVLYNFDNFNTIAYDPNNTYNNGWIDILSVWNQQSTDSYDLNGGYAFYALSTNKYKINETGVVLEGWVTLNGNTYYYDENGNMLKGIQEIDGNKYFFGELSGKLFTTTVTSLNGTTYEPDSEGKLYSRWLERNGNTYHTDSNGALQRGLQEIDGDKYFFGENSYRLFKTTVTSLNGTTYEPDSEGKLYSRWLKKNGNTYHTNANGALQRGLQEIDGNKYFFGENSYRLFTTTVTALDGTIYEPDSEGKLYSRWFERNGNTYHTDENGVKQRGITIIDESKYFLGELSGKLCIGWVISLDSNTYYTNSEGIIQTGYQTIDEIEYYFDDSGKLANGFITIDNITYYFVEGLKQKGITTINGKTYFLGEISGKLCVGWVTALNGNVYYTNAAGEIQKGIIDINDKKYFFGEISGKLCIGFVTALNRNMYYTNSEGIIQTGDVEVEGRWYRFNSNGVLQSGWQTINGNNYYFNLDGSVVTGVAKITGVRYLFSSTGVLLNSNVKSFIDVSYAQGQINWDTLWASGEIDGAILRIGYGSVSSQLDTWFQYNLAAVKRLNIPYTIYLYSYAENSTEAIWEADNLVNWINTYGVNITSGLPIYLDIEQYGSSQSAIAKYTEVIPAFISRMNAYGLGSKVYTYANVARSFSSDIRNYVDWIALYNTDNTYEYSWNGWQYTSSGTASGVSTRVDLSVFK